jgi:hypothetical protein
MIALFDVLGFSARLERDGLTKVVDAYRDLIQRAVLIDAMRCLGARPIGDGTRVPVLFALPVEYAYFSDTILLWVPLEPLFAAPFVSRMEYDVPLKEGNEQHASPVALDWPRKWRETNTEIDIEHVLGGMATAHPHPYYEAAAAFARHSVANHDWFEQPQEMRPNAKLRMRPWRELAADNTEATK